MTARSERTPSSKIVLVQEDDGDWCATDEHTATSARGPTREAALRALDDALRADRDGTDEEIAADDPVFSAPTFTVDDPVDPADTDDVVYGPDE